MIPARTRAAMVVGKATGAVSRRLGFGEGHVIGGRVCRAVDPAAARRLADGRLVAIVSGTNGKTTTTALLAAALAAKGDVASNRSGANLMNGIVAALMDAPSAPVAVLEVDEAYVPWALRELAPAVVVLLNLTRDQLDRLHEVRQVGGRWRQALGGGPWTVVANADDPIVVAAVPDDVAVVWVAAGHGWRRDATACPRCGGTIEFDPVWSCTACDFARPATDVDLDAVPVDLALPGRCNRSNAAMALAAARAAGVDPVAASAGWSTIEAVAGRYDHYRVDGHDVRLLLAKNPAGWVEALDMLDGDAAIVPVLNARTPDGFDPSWIYDVPFERLAGRHVVAAGERVGDLAVRLRYADVTFAAQRDPLDAVRLAPAGRVDVVANYSAFDELRRTLERSA